MTVIEHETATTVRPGWFVARPVWRELALVAAVYGLYSVTRRISVGGAGEAVANARQVLSLERLAGLAPERWLNHVVSDRAFLALPADYAYATLHYLMTPIVLVWLWRAHPTAYLQARRTLMTATLLGLVGFATLPLAPPRMLPGFIDTMARFGNDGWWGTDASVPAGLGSFTNQVAAMPSLHVGWALWCGWQLVRHGQHRVTRWAGVLYPTMISIVVMATGNHYLLDAVAGFAVVLLAMVAVGGVARLLPRRVIDLTAAEASIPLLGDRR